MDPIEIGQRIVRARQDAGIGNPHRFARELGISYESVRSWEEGRTRPRLDNLEHVAERTGADLKWLLFGEPTVRKAPRSRALAEYLATPEGQTCTPEEVAELEREHYSDGEPTALSYHYKLAAIRARAKAGRPESPAKPSSPFVIKRRR